MNTPRNLRLATLLAALLPLSPGSLLAANHPPEIAARGGGRALQFDGVNDYVANTSAAFGIRSNLTVTAWFRNTDDFLTPEYNGQPMGNYLLSKGVSSTPGGPYNDYVFTLGTDRRVSFSIAREDQTQFWVTSLPLPNTPHHFAGVYDFDHSRLRLYVDGQLAGETTATGRLRNYANDLFIGDWNGSSSWHFHHGEMDEVRLWNVARSEADIRREMRFQLATNEPGLVAYWAFDEASGTTALDQAPGGSNGTLVNGPLRLASPVPRFAPVLATNSGPAQITVTLQGSDPDNDPITAYLTQLPAFGSLLQTTDGVTPGAAITTVPTVVTSPSRQVIYRRLPGYTGIDDLQYLVSDGQTNSETATVSLDVVAPSGEAQCTPVPPGIVAWWKGDGTATDSAGTNNGVLTNGATYGLGVVGQAFTFDGASGYLEVPSLNGWNISVGQPMTIEGWIKPTGSNYYSIIVHKGSDNGCAGNGRKYWEFQISPYFLPNRPLEFAAGDGSGRCDQFESLLNVRVGVWQHVAVVVDNMGGPANGYHFYINGTDAGLHVQTDMQIDSVTSSEPVRIGAGKDRDDVVGGFFWGQMDDLAIFNRALSSSEIAAIYAAGAAGMCFGPPVITQQPQSLVVLWGGTAAFQVVAASALPPSYQWRFNGVPLAGGTNSTLSLTNVQPARAGNYDVVVTNFSGSVTSEVAVLTVNLPPEQRALFVNVHGGSYDGDGQSFYQTLVQAGAIATFVNLDFNGKVAALLATNQFDEVWVFDLSSGSDNYPADWQAIGDWFNARTNQVLICDGRSISSYWFGRWQDEGRRLTENYYTHLKLNGGGLVLATDHSAFQPGINSINDRIGIQRFYGDFSLSYIPVDTNSPLMSFPNSMGTQLFDDSSPGQAPFGLQPNGLILYSVAWHSGNTNTPGISTTLRGGVGFRLQIVAPAPGSQFNEKATVSFQAQPANGTAPYTFTWSSDRDGTLGSGQTLQVSTLSPGTHRITVVGTDGGGAADSASVQITVISLPDLAASKIQAPTNALAGQIISVAWTLTNQGSAGVSGAWNVQLGLATNSLGDGWIPLSSFRVTNAFPVGASLVQTGVVIVPAGMAGQRWLTVTADAANEVLESVETNNVLVAADSLTVLCPDVEVRLLTSAPTAVFGQPFGVSWAVTNTGTGPANGTWSDRVWLSSASNSLAGATALADAVRMTALPVGSSYTNTATVTVPLDAQSQPGSYWLVVQADSGGTVAESNEGNNLRSVPLALSYPPLPDLTVGECAGPSAGMPGETVLVTWAVTNLGPAGVTNGVWREAVWLCPTGPTNLTDLPEGLPLLTLTVTNTLPAGEWLLRTQSVTVPVDSETGNLRFVVAVDAANGVVEANETNNVALATNVTVVPAVLSLSMPASLAEGVSASGSVTRNGSRVAALTVTVTNSDASEISFDQSGLTSTATVTIPAGSASASFLVRAVADGIVDGSQVVTLAAAAADFTGATATVTVLDVDIPRLTLAVPGTLMEGMTNTATVARELASAQPLTVTLTAAGSSRLKVPNAVVIPGGATQAVFAVWANENFLVEGSRPCTVNAQAASYQSASANLTLLDNDLPQTTVELTFASTNISEGDGTQATRGTVSRQTVTSEAVVVELANSNPGAIWVPQYLSIPPGQSEAGFFVGAINNDDTNAPVTVWVTVYLLDSVTGARLRTNEPVAITVRDDDGPALRLTLAKRLVPEGQANATTGTVWRNTGTSGMLVVSLTSSDTSEATVPSSVTISNGQNTASFPVATVNDGTPDGSQSVTITASVAGYASGSDVVVVSDTDLPDLTINLLSVPVEAEAESWQQVTYRVENQGVAAAGSNVVRLFLSRTAALSYDFFLKDYDVVPIPPGGHYEQSVPVRMPRETGRFWLVAVVNAVNQFAEIIPDNNTAVSALPITNVAAYSATVSASPPVSVMGTPVTLSGQAVLRDGATPAASKLVNLWVMRGNTNGMRRVIAVLTGADGRFATQLLPLPGEAGYYLVGAAYPGEASAPEQTSFRWLGMQAEPANVSLRMAEQSSRSDHVTIRNLSGVSLSALGVAVINASANLDVTTSLPGGTLVADGTAQLSWSIYARDASVRQALVTLSVTNAEGANVSVPFYVTVDPLVPDLVAEPGTLVRGVLRGGQAQVEFDVVNKGGRETGPITVSLPPLSWLSLVSTNPLPSLLPGRDSTNRVTLLLTPPLDAPLSEFTGSIALNCANGGAGLAVPYRFRALSDNRAPLVVFAEDEYTFYAEGSPLVSNAVVAVTDALSGAAVTNGVTGGDGRFDAGLLAEGYYTVTVTATNHTDYRGTHLVVAGQTNAVHAFISRQAVRYTWTVEPTEIEDRYRITIETTFETKVPMPVITVRPNLIDLAQFPQPQTQIAMTITNDGLVSGFDATITFDDHPLWRVTPLVTNLGTLWASSGLTIPVTIERKAATADCHVPCQFYGRVAWTLVSGGTRYGYNAPITLINAWTNCACPGVPVPPPGIPPGGWAGNGSGGGGGGGGVTPVNNPPPVFTPPEICVPHKDGVCAKVKLQLNQEAVLTREAFKATLELENGTSLVLSNVLVELEIKDAAGFTVGSNMFGWREPVLTAISGVDGSGLLNSNTTGKAEWIIVPSVDAAPETNLTYTVGGWLTYVEGGTLVRAPLAATPIVVHPLPQLTLDYFHERDVLADDPWTRDVVEPSVPYNLAVMVHNTGNGLAKNLRIVSAQPKIIANESGLLIDFKVIATEVAGQNMTPTLTASFGDILPGQIKVGRWLLTSTLHGQFTSYTNWFEHLDSLGNPRLAIITNVAIHEMIHLVRATGAFDDQQPDFLVNEVADPPWDLPDTLYFRQGGKAPVAAVLAGTVTGSPASGSVTLSAAMPNGWAYLRVLEPSGGTYRLTRVVRSDGTDIGLGTNAWVTDRTFGDPLQQPERTNRLHILDFNSTGTYTLYYATPPPRDTNAPTSSVAALPPDSYERISVSWSGADNAGGSGIASFDIYVSETNGVFLPWLQRTTLRNAIYQGTLGHTYAFYSRATDVEGNTEPAPGTPDATTLVSKTNSAPVFPPWPTVVIDEGSTLSFDASATDADGDTLTYQLLNSTNSGLTLSPVTGRLTWPTGEATGPSTNLVTILVEDNGSPRLSATGTLTIVVREVNQAPTLSPIENQKVKEGQWLTFALHGADLDLPAQALSYRLEGAPEGAHLTNGTYFAWQPTELQGPDTNRLAVIVTDNGTPSLSATQWFTVVVVDSLPDFVLSMGSTNLFVGETNAVPIRVKSGQEITNLSFSVTLPVARLAGVSFRSALPGLLPPLVGGPQANRWDVTLTSGAGENLLGDQVVAWMSFGTDTGEHSAIAPVLVSSNLALTKQGLTLGKGTAYGGRVFVVGREPLLDLLAPDWLRLYGHPGAVYGIEGRLTFGTGSSWTNLATLTLAGRFTDLNHLLPPVPTAFFRAVELEAALPWLELAPAWPVLTLRLHGTLGTRYDLLRATNLLGPWLPSGSVNFTNSLMTKPWTNQGEPALFFRLRKQ